MAFTLNPNEIKIPSLEGKKSLIKENFDDGETSPHIADLVKISPGITPASSPDSSTTELLTAFRSEIVVLPEETGPKIIPMYQRYGCGICEKSCLTKKKLNKHIADCHAVDKNFTCQICNKRFRLKNSLNLHAITHTGVKPFKCLSCDKHFTQKSSLNTHVKQFHDLNVKMFECNDCTKKFKLKYFLDMHHLTHNGRKPYKCNICDSKFTQKSSLNTHVKQFHESSVPIFQCMRCDKKFLRETMLDKHIENHP